MPAIVERCNCPTIPVTGAGGEPPQRNGVPAAAKRLRLRCRKGRHRTNKLHDRGGYRTRECCRHFPPANRAGKIHDGDGRGEKSEADGKKCVSRSAHGCPSAHGEYTTRSPLSDCFDFCCAFPTSALRRWHRGRIFPHRSSLLVVVSYSTSDTRVISRAERKTIDLPRQELQGRHSSVATAAVNYSPSSPAKNLTFPTSTE